MSLRITDPSGKLTWIGVGDCATDSNLQQEWELTFDANHSSNFTSKPPLVCDLLIYV